MSNSCKKIKAELVKCIYASDCFNVNGKTFGECLRSENQYELSEYCLNLKHTYFECKRGQVKETLFISQWEFLF